MSDYQEEYKGCEISIFEIPIVGGYFVKVTRNGETLWGQAYSQGTAYAIVEFARCVIDGFPEVPLCDES